MGTATDELVGRAIAGDDVALSELLQEAAPGLHGEFSRQIGDRYRSLVDADDIVQITCLEAFLRIRSFQPVGSGAFFAWLRRIAANNLRDAIKELERDKRPPPGRRAEVGPGDASYVALVDQLAATTTTPSRICGGKELREGVEAGLRQLPADYERVLRLFELEGLSGQEVAERLGRGQGAVRMLLARARERLAEILSGSPQFASRA